MSKAVTRHIWTTEEREIIALYINTNKEATNSIIATAILRDGVLPNDLRYSQIVAQVGVVRDALKISQATPAPTPDPTKEQNDIIQIKYDILVNAIIGKARGLYENDTRKLKLSPIAIDEAIYYVEPEKYMAAVNSFGGETYRRLKK